MMLYRLWKKIKTFNAERDLRQMQKRVCGWG